MMGREHWAEVTLDKVVRSKKGKKPKILNVKEFPNSLPYIDIEAFETGRIKQFADSESSNHCKKTDVLVVWDGARFGLTGMNQEGAIGSTLACLTPIIIEPTFLNKFIQSNYQTIQEKPKGMATPHVDPGVFWNLKFPLPPLPEQKRIVAKLDAILPKVKSAKARLERIPGILKKFRQGVLAAACSGKLTEGWREDYAKQTGKELAEWSERKLGDITDIQGGIQKTPARKPVKYIFPYLRVANVYRNMLSLDKIEYFELFTEEEFRKYRLEYGDILVVEGNGSKTEIGRVAIWHNEIEKCVHQNHIIRCRPIKEKCSPEYVMFFLNSQIGMEMMKDLAVTTAGLYSLSTGKLKQIDIPLPSIEEQQEIVRRIQRLFELADTIGARYKKALMRVEKIEMAVLGKAFRGELVEADPNDEPAEVLLGRILREKEKSKFGMQGRKMI